MTTDEIMAAMAEQEQSAPAEARAKLQAAYAGLVDLAQIVRLTGRGGSRAEIERRMTGARASAPRPAAPRAATPAASRTLSRETQRALDAHAAYEDQRRRERFNAAWMADWHAGARDRLVALISAFAHSPNPAVKADLKHRLAVLDKTGRDPGPARPDADDRAAARLFGMHPQTVAVWARLAAAGGAR